MKQPLFYKVSERINMPSSLSYKNRNIYCTLKLILNYYHQILEKISSMKGSSQQKIFKLTAKKSAKEEKAIEILKIFIQIFLCSIIYIYIYFVFVTHTEKGEFSQSTHSLFRGRTTYYSLFLPHNNLSSPYKHHGI